MTVRCSVCANPVVRRLIDASLADDMTGVGISRYLADAGVKVSPDVVNKHKTHYKPPPERPKGMRKKDFALIVRDTAITQFEGGGLNLGDKEQVPGINAGLKAQAIIDKREAVKKSGGGADLAFAIIAMLEGRSIPRPQLDDGMTIEGEAIDVTPE